MFTTLSVLALASLAYTGATIYQEYDKNKKENKTQAKRNTHNELLAQLSNNANLDYWDFNQLQNYLRDALWSGTITGDSYTAAMNAFTSLREHNFKVSQLTNKELDALNALYRDLYNSDYKFKSALDSEYLKLSPEEKEAFLKGGTQLGLIPAPAYLDTSFENYQREVEPIKHYTNKELADLYKLDFDFDSIKKDYDKAAEAEVVYNDYLSDLLANNAERDNAYNQTSYLDSIRNIKSQAIQQGISNGAKAAADLIANNNAIQEKVTSNFENAQKRFEQVNDSLLNRAQTEIRTLEDYANLANSLSNNANTLYANDIARYGQDILTNANLYASDEDLRANRGAANNLMSSMYNLANATNNVYQAQANEAFDYFKDISLPAHDYNEYDAIQSYINLGYNQDTGFHDPMQKWGYNYNDKK